MMEELNILGVDEAKSKLQLRSITAVFCVLLLVMLLLDPAFTRFADDFFDLLLVPVAQTGNVTYGKTSSNVPDMENTAGNALKELDLRNPAVIPCTDTPCLLTEVVTTNESLNQSEGIADTEKPPMLAMLEDSKMSEILSGPAGLDAEPENPVMAEQPADTSIQAAPKSLPDLAIQPDSKHLADLNLQIDTKEPSHLNLQISSKEPSGIQGDSGSAVSENVIPEPVQDFTADETTQEPIVQEVVQDTLPEGSQAPIEDITGSIISEEPSDIPSAPELAEPDTADTTYPEDSTVSDMIVPSDTETGTEGSTAETTSCFLMDEAGMLFGFLPEYADIQDGRLALPPECTGIRSGAFSGVGAGIEELYIPAGAAMIEAGAFIGLDSLFWIEVESSNPVYTSINGVLFDSTTTVLLSFPAGRTDAYSLPEHVTQIADNAFANTCLSRLDFRRCPSLFLSGNIFGPSSGNGIVIAVPAESLPVYEEMLGTYAVTLTI